MKNIDKDEAHSTHLRTSRRRRLSSA